jgi:purine catabolism regulator
MEKVANDRHLIDGDLPSSAAESDASGMPMHLVAALAVAQDGAVQADPAGLEATVTGARPLQDAVRDALRDGCDLRHQIVLADGPTLRDHPGAAGAGEASDVVGLLSAAGASGLVAAGLDTKGATSLRQRAREANLTLIELPAERLAGFTTEVLAAMLAHQTASLRRLEHADRALVQIVLAGGSLGDLCEQVVGFLDGAVMVTTTDGRVIARAGAPAELEYAESLDCFDRSGRLVTEREPIGVRTDGNASHRAAVRILAGHLDHGVLIAFSRQRTLGVDDVRLLERAATVAALAITKDQAVAAVESKYRAEFLRDALSGRAGAPEEAIAHAASLGWAIDRPMVVVVAETDEDDERTARGAEEVRFLQQRFAKAWTHAVGVRDPKAAVMGFSREVVALVGVPPQADTDRIMRTVGELVRVVRGDGGGGRRSFSAGVSRPVATVTDLPRAYEEALSAVAVGRQMHGDGSLTHVDGLGIYRLLALIPDSAQLRRFVEDSLGELATDDAPENADLRRTLSILIDTNMNVAETARQLFFHYNTLRYRITKLEKMLGPFTDDPDLRLTLALALKVHQMRGI